QWQGRAFYPNLPQGMGLRRGVVKTGSRDFRMEPPIHPRGEYDCWFDIDSRSLSAKKLLVSNHAITHSETDGTPCAFVSVVPWCRMWVVGRGYSSSRRRLGQRVEVHLDSRRVVEVLMQASYAIKTREPPEGSCKFSHNHEGGEEFDQSR